MILSRLMMTYVKIKYRIRYGEKLEGFAYIFEWTPDFIRRRRQKKMAAFYQRAKAAIVPSDHTLEDVANYVVETYGAKAYEPEPRHKDMFITNLIHGKYHHLLKDDFPKKAPLEEQARSIILKRRRFPLVDEEIMAIRDDLAIEPVFYKWQVEGSHEASHPREVTLVMDYESNYMSISGASRELTMDIYKYLGLSQEDLESESPWFKSYALMLREDGELD